MTLEIVTADDRWHDLPLETIAKRASDATLDHVGLNPGGFLIALLACDDARIAELNADFRGKAKPTNVLSWPVEVRDPALRPKGGPPNDPEELGDIAIAYETCLSEAEAGGIDAPDHVTHLIVHAILHLLGYDHETDAQAEVMERLEVEILARMGIANPY
ncbi:MAG: rRNA maturation RNase YbeY [Pseudomonadota bacterium]